MRRQPIYLVIETTEAMWKISGDTVTKCIEKFLENLYNDPFRIETAWLSLITFNEEVEQVRSLAQLFDFDIPDIKFSGSSSITNALVFLENVIKQEVITSSMQIKGDWKPIVFLLISDIAEVERKEVVDILSHFRGCRIIICPPRLTRTAEWLSPVSDGVIQLDALCSDAINRFFKFVSCSIKKSSSSRHIQDKESFPPPPLPGNITLVP